MINFERGDVVLVDFGPQAKVRPSNPDSQRNMTVVVPMTTQIRESECEVSFPKPAWLTQTSVVNLLGIAGVDNSRIERRLAAFPPDRMQVITQRLSRLLDIRNPSLRPSAQRG
jgi:mRNA-degrading endonuclease toxin of MazEF toxin-antitoxin module